MDTGKPKKKRSGKMWTVLGVAVTALIIVVGAVGASRGTAEEQQAAKEERLEKRYEELIGKAHGKLYAIDSPQVHDLKVGDTVNVGDGAFVTVCDVKHGVKGEYSDDLYTDVYLVIKNNGDMGFKPYSISWKAKTLHGWIQSQGQKPMARLR